MSKTTFYVHPPTDEAPTIVNLSPEAAFALGTQMVLASVRTNPMLFRRKAALLSKALLKNSTAKLYVPTADKVLNNFLTWVFFALVALGSFAGAYEIGSALTDWAVRHYNTTFMGFR